MQSLGRSPSRVHSLGMNWLASMVAMLSLGTYCLLRRGAHVTAEAIATVYPLAARRATDGGVEADGRIIVQARKLDRLVRRSQRR